MKTKKVEMSVAEYVAQYNNLSDEKITRHDVYDMIKAGKLKAHRGKRNAWVIEMEQEEKKEYTVRDYVELYNKKHPKSKITIPEARKMLTEGIIEGKKVSGKWVVTQCPRLRIK